MRVAIVGAGIAGLSAARYLRAAGASPVVFEKSSRVGGRVSTRKVGAYVFDAGASSITPRGTSIENVLLSELPHHDLIKITKPIYTHNGTRATPGDLSKNALSRYTYTSGNATLAESLAADADVRLNAMVEGIERQGPLYRLLGEEFDAVVLTPPVPQASALLWTLGESRPIANSRYRPCLSVMFGFDKPIDKPYHALLDPDQRHPLTWLSIESAKCEGRAPEGHAAVVAQLSAWYSLAHFSGDAERIASDTLIYITRLLGKGYETPVVTDIKRWKYAQPDSVALFETVNPIGTRLIVAGDGVLAGRIENAFETGRLASDRLIQTFGAGAKASQVR